MNNYSNNWGLIGHRWAVDLLSARLSAGKIGHAYLFSGMPQIGKQILAKRLAQATNCTGTAPPCGECRSCTLVERSSHPDVIWVEPDGKSIKIEKIREIQRSLTLRPMEARFRIAIIPDAQIATPQAADALLKTLEEPPPTARLLLTIDDVHNVLPTVVSRCQVIPLRPVPVKVIAEGLQHHLDISQQEAEQLARLSGGRPGWALSAAKNLELLEERSTILDMLVTLLHGDRTARFAYSEDLARAKDREHILEVWQSWWRDILLLTQGSSVPPLNSDRYQELEENSFAISPEEAQRALRSVRKTITALDKNVNARLALDVMFLDMPFL